MSRGERSSTSVSAHPNPAATRGRPCQEAEESEPHVVAALLAVSEGRPWAALQCDFGVATAAALRLGWHKTALRPGEPDSSVLRPLSITEAHPNSLSSRYGLEAQPLHTDGAHLRRPPDVVILHNQTTSRTSTALWSPDNGQDRMDEDAWRSGIFTVATGRHKFLASALDRSVLRLDPGCMTPADERAREVLKEAQAARRNCTDFAWSRPGTTLVINNRRALHARNLVLPGDLERRIHRATFQLQDRTQ